MCKYGSTQLTVIMSEKQIFPWFQGFLGYDIIACVAMDIECLTTIQYQLCECGTFFFCIVFVLHKGLETLQEH